MLTDLLTSSKGPGVIGTLLALVVLVGFGSLMFFVNSDSGDGGLGRQIKEKEAGIESAKRRITKWETAAVDYDRRRKQQDELSTLQRNLKSKKTEVTYASEQLEEAKVKLTEVGESFVEYKKKYRIAERAKAIGETKAKLITKVGRTYEQVKVLKVTPIAMKMVHWAGNTRVEYMRVSDEIQDRFQFTKEGAAVIAQKEAAQVAVSEERAEGYHQAVAVRDLRIKIRVANESMQKAKSKINQRNGDIRGYQSKMASAQRDAARFRSRHAAGHKGMTLDNAKKAERRVTLYQNRTKSAHSEIAKLNKEITEAKRSISKLEAEVVKIEKAKK